MVNLQQTIVCPKCAGHNTVQEWNDSTIEVYGDGKDTKDIVLLQYSDAPSCYFVCPQCHDELVNGDILIDQIDGGDYKVVFDDDEWGE